MVFGEHQIAVEVCTAMRQIASSMIQICGMCHTFYSACVRHYAEQYFAKHLFTLICRKYQLFWE